MANKIPLAYADVELQISTAIAIGETSFSVASANDDDGVALPAGKYCFTLDNSSTNKEYLIGQLNGTDVTAVYSVSRQGVESSGAVREHRVGTACIVTDFATIQRVADILRGVDTLDGASPIIYDAEPTLSDRKSLATVGYVLDIVTGGTVSFDNMTVAGNGGEDIVAGNLVYFKTSDQEWYLTDADTAATVEGVQLGIALGSGSNGAAVTGGMQIAGTWTTSGLTAGALYYAGNTAGAISASAGTTSKVIGLALSATKLLLIPSDPQTIKDAQKDALVGGSTFGTPSSTNKFLTQDYNASATGLPIVRTYLNAASPATWTKPAGLKYIAVETQAAGGNGGTITGSGGGGGGGGGAYGKKLIGVASLGSTETITIGAVGANTSFGAHLVAGYGASVADNTQTGGLGGTCTGGDTNIVGGTGGEGNVFGGYGGSAVLGNGGKNGTSSSVPGGAGTGYGAGGGGGYTSVSADSAGGAGAPAIVIVTEYYS